MRRTTPQRLRVIVAAGWVLIGILGAMITSSAFEHRDAVHAIGVDAAPSVTAAHRIKVEVESLDADLVNEMLVPEAQAKHWQTDFAQNRIELGRHLLNASRSAFGDHEHAALEKLEDTLGLYLMAAQETLDAHRRNEREESLRTYRIAFDLLEQQMIPAADQLNKISDDDLEAAYEKQEHHSHSIRTFVGAFGILLLGVLVAIQSYMAGKFRRRLSAGIVGAIALTLILMSYSIGAFRENSAELTALKTQSYDNVDKTLASLSYAYEAKSSQSRWLFDRERAPAAEQRFAEYVAKVVFPDARVAGDFEAYRKLDPKFRVAETSNHDVAIDFALNGDGERAFEAFDASLERYVQWDEEDLKHHTAAAMASVKRMPYVVPVLTLLIAIAFWLGIRPRLKEYAR